MTDIQRPEDRQLLGLTDRKTDLDKQNDRDTDTQKDTETEKKSGQKETEGQINIMIVIDDEMDK